jgi:hypothetical protein
MILNQGNCCVLARWGFDFDCLDLHGRAGQRRLGRNILITHSHWAKEREGVDSLEEVAEALLCCINRLGTIMACRFMETCISVQITESMILSSSLAPAN